MGNKLLISKRKIKALLSLLLLVCLVGIINNHVLSMVIAYIFWFIGISFSIKKIRSRFSLFSFNIGFLIFILGGFTISFCKDGNFSYFSNYYFTSSNEANIHTFLCVAICMICVNCGYIAFCDYKKESGKQEFINSNLEKESNFVVASSFIKRLLMIIIFASYTCRIIRAIEEYLLVKSISYYDSVSYLTTLPAFVIHIGSLYYITLFMYLATFPSKKVTRRLILTLIILEAIILAAGSRGEPISIILLIIFYVYMRNKAGYYDIWIPKKYFLIGLIITPFLMYTLQALSYTRNNVEYNESFLDGVTSFVETQGGSAKIIANSYDLDKKIFQMTQSRSFVFGEIRSYFKSNIFTRLLTDKTITLRTVEDAYSGDNFLRSYGYAYAPVTYLNNVGSGSTYIAETYYDGGYFFLVIANIFIAFLLATIDKISVNNFISCAILMNIFRYMPTLPRGMMLDWLVNTFAVQNIILFAIIYLFCYRNAKPERGTTE